MTRPILRLLKKPVRREPDPITKRWGDLTRSVDADELAAQVRAQSLLSGWIAFLDGGKQAPFIPYAQAQDVLRWAGAMP